MALHRFEEKLEYSRGVREQTDAMTIQALLTGCVDVAKTDLATDRAGIDYIATLRNGATVYVDAKTRTPGCSRYWRQGPELALERWSVRPGGKYATTSTRQKTGWTLSEASCVDYILFTFAPQDSGLVFLYPYQLLRVTFRRMLPRWAQAYKSDIQDSGSWESECLFVPESAVWAAMRDSMCAEAA